MKIGEGKAKEPREQVWQVYVDGALKYQEVRVGIILISPEWIRIERSFRLGFLASNNKVEYEVLLARLRVSRQIGADII